MDNLFDLLHGLILNLGERLAKYSWMDAVLYKEDDSLRETQSNVLLLIRCPLDLRADGDGSMVRCGTTTLSWVCRRSRSAWTATCLSSSSSPSAWRPRPRTSLLRPAEDMIVDDMEDGPPTAPVCQP
jgi:hypothetical protein